MEEKLINPSNVWQTDRPQSVHTLFVDLSVMFLYLLKLLTIPDIHCTLFMK